MSRSPARGGLSFRWSLPVPFVLAAILLVLAFRGVHWGTLASTIRHGRPQFLALAFVATSFTYFLRGLRWRVLLTAEGEVSPLTAFFGAVVGYLGNSVLPARAGELIRSVLMARRASMSVSYVLATAITERIMDTVTLVLISVVALLSIGGMPAWLLTAAKVMAVVACAGLVFVFVAPRFEGLLRTLLHRLPLPAGLIERLDALLGQFLLGMRTLHVPARAASFVGLTVPIWLIDGVMTMAFAAALHLTISLPQGLLLLAALGLSSAAPSTPGFVGVFQFVAVSVLVPFHFTRDQALAYILTYQAVIYLVVLVWGPIGLWQLHGWSRSTLELSLADVETEVVPGDRGAPGEPERPALSPGSLPRHE